MNEVKPKLKRAALIEGTHYYYEGPYMVFTEVYLRERGFCCNNNCRHCPYKEAGAKTITTKNG